MNKIYWQVLVKSSETDSFLQSSTLSFRFVSFLSSSSSDIWISYIDDQCKYKPLFLLNLLSIVYNRTYDI